MEDSKAGLRPDQVARLLSISAAPFDVEADERDDRPVDKALRDKLASELFADVSISDSPSAVLGRPCDELQAHRGRAMGELLLDRNTDLEALKTLKEYGKTLVRRSRSEVARAVAAVVYYAAIAAALVFHNEKITQHSYSALDHSFGMLADKRWMARDLADLFAKARERCQ